MLKLCRRKEDGRVGREERTRREHPGFKHLLDLGPVFDHVTQEMPRITDRFGSGIIHGCAADLSSSVIITCGKWHDLCQKLLILLSKSINVMDSPDQDKGTL
ncbi:UNVERIFIED_CONTAM: hypothetical protein PYX00_009467 [Menopon gallinae]|uniref:Uncharacterized protein n=1 Tax=Menopon gallinae TaxID=328185 RepID=A0AAW2HBH0_9NEOP